MPRKTIVMVLFVLVLAFPIRGESAKELEDTSVSQVTVIDKAAKKAGHKGYAAVNLVELIYETQKKGGLENYVDKVIGCTQQKKSVCDDWYAKVRIVQVSDKGSLYSFVEFVGDDIFSFDVFVENEPGKIYQQGQSLKNILYVFKGMGSYFTVLGAVRNIPVFAIAQKVDVLME